MVACWVGSAVGAVCGLVVVRESALEVCEVFVALLVVLFWVLGW